MRKPTTLLGLALASACLIYAVLVRTPAPDYSARSTQSADPADRLDAQWRSDYENQRLAIRTPIPLRFSRAFSKHFTRADGVVEINFETGSISVRVKNLDAPSDGFIYQVWLVENGAGPGNTAAIEFGENGDHILNLGMLPATGSMTTSLDVATFDRFNVDMAAVMRISPGQTPSFVIGGMQSVRHEMGRKLAADQKKSRWSTLVSKLFPTVLAAPPAGSKNLIEQGRNLFSNGTFGGNGRTCATCHVVAADFTIDSALIAALSQSNASDPLFVSEFDANLPPFNDSNPTQPAFESPSLMRNRGLILENIDGFERDATGNLVRPPVFRMTPGLFNLSLTAPYGDSACCADLQIFSAGAVVQHFTKTLNRTAGVDFVVPTATELKALEAFMLSISSPGNANFKVSGRGSLLSTKSDPLASDVTRPEVRGRNFFTAANCIACHSNTVFANNVLNLDTGVEAFGRNNGVTPTLDDGDGNGFFQVPPLFGLRKTHFFHNGAVGNATQPLPGRTLLFTNLRASVAFYTSQEFIESPEGHLLAQDGTFRFQRLFDMSPDQIDDVTAFLEAISKP